MIAYNNDFKLMMVLTLCADAAGHAAAQRGSRVEAADAGGDRMKRLRRSGSSASRLALSRRCSAGCAVGPDFMRPEPPRADRYTAAAAGHRGCGTAPAATRAARRVGAKLGARTGGSSFQSRRRSMTSCSARSQSNRTLVGRHGDAGAGAGAGRARRPARSYPQVGLTRRHRPAEIRRAVPRAARRSRRRSPTSRSARRSAMRSTTPAASRAPSSSSTRSPNISGSSCDAAYLTVTRQRGACSRCASRCCARRSRRAQSILEQDRRESEARAGRLRCRVGVAARHRERREPARQRCDAAAAAAPGAERRAARARHRARRGARRMRRCPHFDLAAADAAARRCR